MNRVFACASGYAAVVLFLLLVPVGAPAVGLRWAVSGGIGQPTEISRYVGPSPRLAGALMTRFTERTFLGMIGDYTSYQTKRPDADGFQWRVLLQVEWTVGGGLLPAWAEPFGEFGIGVGRMRYVGVKGTERLVGPASRLAAGLNLHLHPRVDLSTSLSFDRLDTAANSVERRYPSMLSLNLALAFHWPRGGPLIPSVSPSYLKE